MTIPPALLLTRLFPCSEKIPSQSRASRPRFTLESTLSQKSKKCFGTKAKMTAKKSPCFDSIRQLAMGAIVFPCEKARRQNANLSHSRTREERTPVCSLLSAFPYPRCCSLSLQRAQGRTPEPARRSIRFDRLTRAAERTSPRNGNRNRQPEPASDVRSGC